MQAIPRPDLGRIFVRFSSTCQWSYRLEVACVHSLLDGVVFRVNASLQTRLDVELGH